MYGFVASQVSLLLRAANFKAINIKQEAVLSMVLYQDSVGVGITKVLSIQQFAYCTSNQTREKELKKKTLLLFLLNHASVSILILSRLAISH